MTTPARFSDGQYKNWIKCSQSLIIMKEALHDYIDKEVKRIHSDITQKVASIPCGSSTRNQCSHCSWKNIKPSGGKHGTWYINCKKNICDKWLHQILAVHDNPHNPTINWKNADVGKWPTDCYHVAKIFMPKGQDRTTKLPNDFDAPAILSLMKYCNWFRKDLPNTQILSDLIDIRNKVLHSGDMRVTDGDKDSWIDLMIQLLNDLNIHGDAQVELQMVKKEDIDMNFRETEITVLQKMMSGLVNELNTVKEEMISVQTPQSYLSSEMEKLRDSNTETTGKVNIMNIDIEQMKKDLEELKIIYDKIVSFFDRNPGILDNVITETIRNIGTDVQEQQRNLLEIETELKGRICSLETNQVEITKQVEGLQKRLVVVEGQIENDERLSLKSEAITKRRPESDGLKRLKNQTEDRLDTLRRLECIPTKQAEDAKNLLECKRSIVIKGNPGEGKTTTALHLIDNERYRDKRVVLENPKQWEHVDTDWVNIAVLEDVFGKFDLDNGRLQEWMIYLSTIQEHVDAGKLRIIVTSRVDILSKTHLKLESLKLFSDDLSLTLSSENLTYLDKMGILNRELYRHGRNMNDDEKEKCIYNFNGLIGFPQCCFLFAGDSKLFETGPEFFGSPRKFFVENITQLEDKRFLSLAFLFCNGKTCEEHLSSKTMPKASKHLLKKLASILYMSKKEEPITLLRNAYEDYCKLYVVKSKSYNLECEIDKPYIWFTHATVCEAVGQVLGDRCLEILVRYGDSEYLYQRTYTAETKDGTSQKLFIPVSLYGLLAERMVRDVQKSQIIGSVVKHSALKQQNFLTQLKCELHRGAVIKDFFMAVSQVMAIFDDHLSEGKCFTIMQHVLQSDEQVVKLVYSQLLVFLACAHNNYNSSDCWQCEEKQKLLELALYYRHFEIADKLITMNACYTHISLCNAARHCDRGRIATILEILKRSQIFNPECNWAKYALCRAYISGNQISIELLLKEGIVLDSCHVVDVVEHGDINVLMKVVEHLKLHKKWNPHLERHEEYDHLHMCLGNTKFKIPCITALYSTYCNEKFDMTDYLLKCEAKLSMHILVDVLDSSSKKVVARVIQNLKDTGIWNPCCKIATEALEEVYVQEKNDIYDLLVREGVSLKMNNFLFIIVRSQMSLESATNTIQLLKDFKNWDPKCCYASKALEEAYRYQKFDLIYLLVQEGVSLAMNNLPSVLHFVQLEDVKKLIQNFKDTVNWDPKCDYASDALAETYITKKYDVFDLLIQEGVSLKMKNLPGVLRQVSLESAKKVIQHLKDTGNWDPNHDDVSKELASAYRQHNSDMYNLLIQEGVSLKMKNLPEVLLRVSLDFAEKIIQHLKDTDNWDPMCNDASDALANAYKAQKHDVSDLLVHEGVTLTINNLASVLHYVSLESVKKAIIHMKDIASWDPRCDDASELLEISYIKQKYDVFDLLIQEGVTLNMKNFPAVVHSASLEYVKKAVQHLKDTDNWDPKCDDASDALVNAYSQRNFDVYDLLVQEGVSLNMKNLPAVVHSASLEYVKKTVQHLKDTDNWDPKCDNASDALVNAYSQRNYDVYDLLVQEGVSLNMKNLPLLVLNLSLESVKKAIQHLKDTVKWDPKCDDASKAIRIAYAKRKYDVCDLLVQEGVSLTMENLPHVIFRSLEYVQLAVTQLKGIDNWDPKCDYASKALENAYSFQKDDVCNLLFQEGVSLTMTNLPGVIMGSNLSFLPVKRAIQHLKDSNQWDSSSEYAQMSFAIVNIAKETNLCDLLINEGVAFRDKDYYFQMFSNDYFNL